MSAIYKLIHCNEKKYDEVLFALVITTENMAAENQLTFRMEYER